MGTQQHLILTPSAIANHIHEPLHPMVALEYVFSKQQCSLFGLEDKDNPTVKSVYSIAKQTVDQDIRKQNATMDVFVNVCTQIKTLIRKNN